MQSAPSTLGRRATSEQVRAYYQAAILGLRALDQLDGTPRRFGPDADSRWARFRGKLHEGDRLQLLIRDASAPWGIAFSASRIFRLDGVALDEPFGPGWISPNADQARRYHTVPDPPTLDACARILGTSPAPVDLPSIRPNSRILATGGAATLALLHAFQGREDLEWARQVVIVADNPEHRQLAGLASLFSGGVRPCDVITSRDPLPEDAVRVHSTDAEPDCLARLRR